LSSAELFPKTLDPASFEGRQSRRWEEARAFEPRGGPGDQRFSVVIAPPNVTGKIHIGHALENSLVDVLVRWKRMKGFRTVWVPGTDHAGIATQMVVERELAKKGIDRRAIGRERFVEQIWEWKRFSKDSIVEQLKRLGCSLDWSRERFTLDEGLSRAVRKVFVDLFREGLVYRGQYVVNWCPRCETAVSDLEVNHVDTDGKLYLIRYDIESGGESAVVATTRPETMLGDTALAIAPGDPRTSRLTGKTAILPIVGRRLPIVEDDFVDREFGTGIVKITPAHDANDFACAGRHGLPAVVVIGPDGKMAAAAGEYAGMDRFEARTRVLARLESDGRLVETRPHSLAVGRCQRCDTVIEPYLSTQWFVRVATLAAPAIEAVESGRIAFVPEMWKKTYFEWMRHIHDWCISRQLWWGHRIPAYYCADGHVTVSESDPPACSVCGRSPLTQDPDVLDTWFSSQLWPFSVFGWPEQTEDLRDFYPTDVLVSGFDILFFWDARMIMAGLKMTGSAPFSTLHLHGLVRDENGEKMSKTRGNVIDPLDVIAEFGADAVRFTLLALASPGRDLPLARNRMAGSKAFLTKLWNATRFVLLQIEGRDRTAPEEGSHLSLLDRALLSRLSETAAETNRFLADFRFDLAASALYDFVWRDLCDRHLEMVKPLLSGKAGTDAERASSRGVLAHVLESSLALLHPLTPFVTEEIWERLKGGQALLTLARYPEANAAWRDPEAESAVTALAEILTRVRNFRTERGAGPSEPVELSVSPGSRIDEALRELASVAGALGRLGSLRFAEAAQDEVRDVVAGVSIGLKLSGTLPEADRTRVDRELRTLEREIEQLSERLANPEYLDRAPSEVVEKTRLRLFEMEQRRAALSGSPA
jgi:valyl-tRNA synthetase